MKTFLKITIVSAMAVTCFSCAQQQKPKKQQQTLIETNLSKKFVSPIKNIGWVGVKADKLPEADKFFTEILEFDKHSSIPEMDIEIYQLPSGQYFELMSHKTPNVDVFIKPFLGFEVANIDKARKVLEANGLHFEGKTFKIPTGGWAFFKDADGNLMEIVQNPPRKDFSQNNKKLKILGMGWIGIDVEDHKRSYKFFKEKLGFNQVPLPGENNPYTLMEFKDRSFFEVLDHLKEEIGVAYPMVAFQVPNIREAVEILKERKVKLIGKIGGNPGLTVQTFEGPDGIRYQLAEIIPPK